MQKFIVPIAAIAGLVILDSIALIKGIDGTLMLAVASLIGGIGGFTLRHVRKVK